MSKIVWAATQYALFVGIARRKDVWRILHHAFSDVELYFEFTLPLIPRDNQRNSVWNSNISWSASISGHKKICTYNTIQYTIQYNTIKLYCPEPGNSFCNVRINGSHRLHDNCQSFCFKSMNVRGIHRVRQ